MYTRVSNCSTRLARRAAWGVLGMLLVAALPVRAQAPAWTVNPAAFEQNMSVVAAVSVGGVRLAHPGDRLAAFVGAEVRGVAAPTAVNGASVFFLPVYANTGGETITFKVYDAGANVVRDLAPGLPFASNAVQGSATAPLALAPGGTTGGGGGDPDGWEVNPADYARTMSVVGVLRYADGSGAGVGDRVAAFVGGQVRGVATPVDVGGQRVFFLPVYANTEGETITFKVASGGTVRDAGGSRAFAGDEVVGTAEAPHVWAVAGSPAGGADDPSGWTVTPAAFERSMNVVAALFTGGVRATDPNDRIAAFVDGEVRGVAAPQSVGGAWLAFLTVYGRAEGEAVTFKAYDASTGQVLPVAEGQRFGTNAVVGTATAPQALTARSASAVAEDPRTWSVTPAGFEQSMNAVGQARVGTATVGASGSRVAAFVGGQVRGVSGPTPAGGQSLFFLTVYGRTGDGAVSYKTFDGSTGRVYDVVQATPFEANRVEGAVNAPFGLSAAADPTSLFVYPGDASGDGRVNQNDLFPLSFYFGLTGPARAGASVQFQPELVGAWAPAAAALADMNGDGRINQNDLFPLGLNYGRVRPADGFAASGGAFTAPAFGRTGGSTATIRGVVPTGDVRAGDTLRVSVQIAGAAGVRAAGFQVAFDTSAFTPLGRVRGTRFSGALLSGDALELTKQAPGRFAYGVTLSGPAAAPAEGEVVTLLFRVRAVPEGARPFTFSAAEAMDAGGARLVLQPEPLAVRITAQATHALPLAPGWNLVSSHVRPAAPGLAQVTAGVGGLVLVKDLVGRVYWPELGLSTLANWEHGAAYLVFMREAGALALSGQMTRPETVTLSLPAGWNLVGYLRNGPMAPAAALASLGDALVLAKDLAGRVYWPAFGLSTLGSLAPGDGLYLYLSRPATLTFPANDAGASGNRLAAPAPVATRYGPTSSAAPGGGLLLVHAPALPEGAEVGAFTAQGRLVGGGVVTGGRALLALRADDPQTPEPDGAEAGDPLRVVVWDGQAARPLALTQVRDGLRGTPTALHFQPSGVWIAEAAPVPETAAPEGLWLDGPHPHPVAGPAHVTLSVGSAQRVRVAVYDLAGRAVAVLHEGLLAPGIAHTLRFDGATLPSGLYVLRVEGVHATLTRKLVLMH